MEKNLTPKGYVKILPPGLPDKKKNYVREHRFVAEQKIGRKLTKSEVVHHIDEHKENNKIGNLFIFKNQKEHQKFHLRIKQFGYTNPIRREIRERWIPYLNDKKEI